MKLARLRPHTPLAATKALALASLLALGCAAGSDPLAGFARLAPERQEDLILALEDEIDQDQSRLADWVATPRQASDPALHEDSAVRTLAIRILENQERLATYRERRRSREPTRPKSARPGARPR